MPVHLIFIMMASIALMLWLAFEDGGDAELPDLQAETDLHADPDLPFETNDMDARRFDA